MGLGKSLRTLWALKKQAEAKAPLVEQNISAWDHFVTAYHRGASLPGMFRIFGGVTEAKVDDKVGAAVDAALGEMKQALFNASELLRGNAAMLTALAAQLDGAFAFLDAAEKGSLKKLLEG